MVSTLHYQGGKNRISDELSEIMGGGNSNLKYQGGKSRLANDLSKIMMGGGNVATNSYHYFVERVA